MILLAKAIDPRHETEDDRARLLDTAGRMP